MTSEVRRLNSSAFRGNLPLNRSRDLRIDPGDLLLGQIKEAGPAMAMG